MPLAIWMCQMTEKHAVCAHKPICVQDFDKWIDLISRFHSRKFSLFSIFYWENIFSCFTIAAINVKCYIKSDISIVAFQLFEKRKLEKNRTHSLTTSVELLFSILHFPIECIFTLNFPLKYGHWSVIICIGNHHEAKQNQKISEIEKQILPEWKMIKSKPITLFYKSFVRSLAPSFVHSNQNSMNATGDIASICMNQTHSYRW